MGDIIGVAFYVAIALVGLVSTVLASVWTWRLVRRRGLNPWLAAIVVTVAAAFAFLGLWMVFDLYWIVAAVFKLARRSGGTRPATQN
jgi:hypothetical protein